jgi:hypothetical protein
MANAHKALYTEFSPAALSPEALVMLSRRIDELHCDPLLIRYCARYGVMYLGEACYLNWSNYRRFSDDREELGGLLNQQGLSFGNNPVALGWQPPYWENAEWRAFLDKPVSEVLQISRDGMRLYWINNASLIGELIRNLANLTPTHWMWFQTDYGRANPKQLRAGMIVPPDWRPELVPRQALAFGTAGECRHQVDLALRAHTNLTGSEFERTVGELTTIVERVGAKALVAAISAVVGKLPLVVPEKG